MTWTSGRTGTKATPSSPPATRCSTRATDRRHCRMKTAPFGAVFVPAHPRGPFRRSALRGRREGSTVRGERRGAEFAGRRGRSPDLRHQADAGEVALADLEDAFKARLEGKAGVFHHRPV